MDLLLLYKYMRSSTKYHSVFSPSIAHNIICDTRIDQKVVNKRNWSGDALKKFDALTCLHSLWLLIRVLLILPPLRSSVALTFTIEQLPPFLIDSQWIPYHNTVPYPCHLSDITRLLLFRTSLPPVRFPTFSSLFCATSEPPLFPFFWSDPWSHHLIDFPLGLFLQLLCLLKGLFHFSCTVPMVHDATPLSPAPPLLLCSLVCTLSTFHGSCLSSVCSSIVNCI